MLAHILLKLCPHQHEFALLFICPFKTTCFQSQQIKQEITLFLCHVIVDACVGLNKLDKEVYVHIIIETNNTLPHNDMFPQKHFKSNMRVWWPYDFMRDIDTIFVRHSIRNIAQVYVCTPSTFFTSKLIYMGHQRGFPRSDGSKPTFRCSQ